jgi:hypothetical protein
MPASPSFKATAQTMTDQDLIREWEQLPNHEVLDEWAQAVFDEMELRNLGF